MVINGWRGVTQIRKGIIKINQKGNQWRAEARTAKIMIVTNLLFVYMNLVKFLMMWANLNGKIMKYLFTKLFMKLMIVDG